MKKRLITHMFKRLFTGVFVATLVLCIHVRDVDAQRIALLPLGDVSHGTNGIDGVNQDLTQEFFQVLNAQGLELVQIKDIEQFMIYNRVRFVGYLDSFLARKIGLELECSHVLVGTVTEYQDGPGATLGVTLTMFDTSSGEQVWGGSRAMSADEFVGALGLGEPKGVQEIQDRIFSELLTEVVANLREDSKPRVKTPYQIVDLQLSSKYIHGGDSLDCQLEMNFLEKTPRRLTLKSGSKEFPLVPGSAPGYYVATVLSEQDSGIHDLTLVIDWGEDNESEIVSGLASYQVINAPPELDLKLNQGVEVADITLFSKQLVMVPNLSGNQLMDRWTVVISNDKGGWVVSEEHMGNLPGRLVWDGKDKKGRKVRDGRYTIALKAWDVVGNEAEKELTVYLQTEPTPLDLQMFSKDGKKYLEIQPSADVSAPLVSWELIASSSQGEKVLHRGGVDLPAILEIPDQLGDGSILFDLQTKDSLGNRLQMKRSMVDVGLAKGDNEKPAFAATNESVWLDNF